MPLRYPECVENSHWLNRHVSKWRLDTQRYIQPMPVGALPGDRCLAGMTDIEFIYTEKSMGTQDSIKAYHS